MGNIILPKPALGTPLDVRHNLAQGLVANYQCNEGAGGILKDSSPYGNDGTISGPTWTGDGLYFDGNDYTDHGIIDALHFPGGSYSGSVWFKIVTLPALGAYGGLFEQSNNSNNGWQFFFRRHGSNETVRFYFKQLPIVQTFTGYHVVADGLWHHAAFIVSGASAEIYLDGVQLSATHGSHVAITPSTTAFRIGRSGTKFLNGNVSDVSIYNRALSAGEILQLHRYQQSLLFADPNQLALWAAAMGGAGGGGIVPIIQAHRRRRAG